MSGQEIEKLAKIIAKLPALGTRSSRRIVLYLLKKRETALLPLIEALQEVAANVKTCEVCGNYDTLSPCSVCCSENATDIPSAWYRTSPICGQWSGSVSIRENTMFWAACCRRSTVFRPMI